MRLGRSRSSQNVEDRRSSGPRIGRGKIGLGTVVLALVAMYFGIDPNMVLNLADGPTGQPPAQSVPANDAQGQYIAKVLGETEDVWRDIFRQQTNGQYSDPVLEL